MPKPVIDDYLADPFIFRHEEVCYAIGTGRGLMDPGHMSTFTARDGVTQLIAYHACDAGMMTRRCHIERLEWTREGPVRRSL